MGRAGKAGLVIALGLAGAFPALGADIAEKAAPCLACHGENGQSQTENVPSLGAQLAPYVVTQLFLFREQLRIAPPMNDMAKGLSDDDLRALADLIAKLPAPKPPDGPLDQARVDRAKALVQENRCNFCHHPDFAGGETVPRLADQREDYLLKTLRDYKSGARRGYDATMPEVVQTLDDAQLADLAYYLAHFH